MVDFFAKESKIFAFIRILKLFHPSIKSICRVFNFNSCIYLSFLDV